MSFTPLNDFPGYEISHDGMVRSWKARGLHQRVRKAHPVTPVWLKSNRWAVRLVRDGQRHLRCVANLVLETFVGPPPSLGVGHGDNLADVVFKDGDPTNVALANLEWKIQD